MCSPPGIRPFYKICDVLPTLRCAILSSSRILSLFDLQPPEKPARPAPPSLDKWATARSHTAESAGKLTKQEEAAASRDYFASSAYAHASAAPAEQDAAPEHSVEHWGDLSPATFVAKVTEYSEKCKGTPKSGGGSDQGGSELLSAQGEAAASALVPSKKSQQVNHLLENRDTDACVHTAARTSAGGGILSRQGRSYCELLPLRLLECRHTVSCARGLLAVRVKRWFMARSLLD